MEFGYTTACEAWGCELEDVVILQDEQGTHLGNVPLPFMKQCVATTTVAYLRYVIRELLSLGTSAEIVLQHNGERLDHESEAIIEFGVYQYSFPSSCQAKPLIGPQGKSLSRSYQETDGSSTVSRSSRTSSVGQNTFRERLCLRDGHCIVTGVEEIEILVPAHIIPYSLGHEFLYGLTNYPGQVSLNSVNNGLLLSPEMHKAYDRFRWGIFVSSDNKHYVHMFDFRDRTYHGMEIKYRCRSKSLWPNKSLLQWQYRQCLAARIRGSCVRGGTLLR